MSDIRSLLADTLRGHRLVEVGIGCDGCSCGNTKGGYFNHLADVLLALDRVAIIELPEPVAVGEDSDYGPTCLARWESVETGEITAWPGGVVGVWDQNHLDPDDARALAAALLAAAMEAEKATEAGK